MALWCGVAAPDLAAIPCASYEFLVAAGVVADNEGAFALWAQSSNARMVALRARDTQFPIENYLRERNTRTMGVVYASQ